MNPTLMTLLEIQDLRSKRRELAESPEVEAEQFNVDVEAARASLASKIDELAASLEGPVRRKYDRIEGSLDRVVVPVIHGICYGCFVSVAAATVGEESPNALVQSCETCGRFLYFA